MKHVLEKHAPFLVIIILLVIGLIYFAVFRAPAQEGFFVVPFGEALPPEDCGPAGVVETPVDKPTCLVEAPGAIVGETALNAVLGDEGRALCVNSSLEVGYCADGGETSNIGAGTAVSAPANTGVAVAASPLFPLVAPLYVESVLDNPVKVEVNSINTNSAIDMKLELSADATGEKTAFKSYTGGLLKGWMDIDENGVATFNGAISLDGVSTERAITADAALRINSALGDDLTVEGGGNMVLRAGGPVGPGFEVATLSGTNGYLGIGWATPEAPLHISDFMKLEPRSSAPFSPVAGFVYVRDDTSDLFCFYDGTAWQELTAGSDALCN